MNKTSVLVALVLLAGCSGGNEEPFVLPGHTVPVKALAFSRDGKFLASGDVDGALRLWDLDRHDAVRILSPGSPKTGESVLALAFSPDGKIVASGFSGATLWDREQGTILRKVQGHEQQVTCLAFSPDGKILATGSADRSVRLWDVGTGRAAGVLKDLAAAVQAVAFSSDGNVLAAGGETSEVVLWDWRKPAMTGKVTLPSREVAALARSESPTGFLVCTAAGGILEVSASSSKATPKAQAGAGELFALSLDGRTSAAAGRTQGSALEVRRVPGGTVMRFNSMPGHPELVVLQDNGGSVGVGLNDGRILRWMVHASN